MTVSLEAFIQHGFNRTQDGRSARSVLSRWFHHDSQRPFRVSLEASLKHDFIVTHGEVIVIHDEANPEQHEKSQQILIVSLLPTRRVFQHDVSLEISLKMACRFTKASFQQGAILVQEASCEDSPFFVCLFVVFGEYFVFDFACY